MVVCVEDEKFVTAARIEMLKVERAIADYPSMLRRQKVLRAVLIEYGNPMAPETPAAEQRRESTEVSTEGVVKRGPMATPLVVTSIEEKSDDKPEHAPAPQVARREGQAGKLPDPAAPNSRKGSPRPADIPTTFAMVYRVLNQESGLTSRAVSERMASRWWPGLHHDQIGPEFYTFVKTGKLKRDDDGRLTLTDAGRLFYEATAGGNKPTAPGPRPETPKQTPVARPAPPPPARSSFVAEKLVEFRHGDKTTTLRPQEWRVVAKMIGVLNNGFMPNNALVDAGLPGEKRNAVVPSIWLADMRSDVNPKLAEVGLEMVPYEKIGYFLREVSP